MRFVAIASAFLGLAASVWADTITVMVAQNGTLTFTPNSVSANQGDVIAFQFVSGNHSVTQSTFASPCTMLASGIDSGFQQGDSSASTVPQYSFTVNNASTPLWFYCRQTGHCKSGMVFAVNPTATNTFDAFKANAEGNGSGSSSSPTSSSTGSGPSPSSSGYSSSSNAAVGFDSSKLAGTITLVAIIAGSFL